MNAFELISLVHYIGSRLDIQMGFFITIHLALFGGIIYVDRPLRVVEKCVALFLYTGFAFINYYIMTLQFEQLYAAYEEIAKLGRGACCQDNVLVGFYSRIVDANSFDNVISYALIVHIVMIVIVFLTIIFDKARN